MLSAVGLWLVIYHQKKRTRQVRLQTEIYIPITPPATTPLYPSILALYCCMADTSFDVQPQLESSLDPSQWRPSSGNSWSSSWAVCLRSLQSPARLTFPRAAHGRRRLCFEPAVPHRSQSVPLVPGRDVPARLIHQYEAGMHALHSCDANANPPQDLGPCPKVHSENLKTEYDGLAAAEKQRYAFEYDYMRDMHKYIDDCNRRIDSAQRRLEKTPDEIRQTNALVRGLRQV